MATKKKTAMVKPKPSGPVPRTPTPAPRDEVPAAGVECSQTEIAGSNKDLAYLLKELSVDRPYTILSHKDRVYRVHFYGDPGPCTVKIENGKAVIKK